MRRELEGLIKRLELDYDVKVVGVASSDEMIKHLIDGRDMVLPSFADGLPSCNHGRISSFEDRYCISDRRRT